MKLVHGLPVDSGRGRGKREYELEPEGHWIRWYLGPHCCKPALRLRSGVFATLAVIVSLHNARVEKRVSLARSRDTARPILLIWCCDPKSVVISFELVPDGCGSSAVWSLRPPLSKRDRSFAVSRYIHDVPIPCTHEVSGVTRQCIFSSAVGYYRKAHPYASIPPDRPVFLPNVVPRSADRHIECWLAKSVIACRYFSR